jgi:ring-1,2-phenylacetyl-CoA epoxidase subunit PaaC
MSHIILPYTLHLADNTLILAQRNSEWCGHGPVLEQDIAITNISLDLLGQANNFYQYAANVYNHFSDEEKRNADIYIPRFWKTYTRDLREDDMAFLREEHQYLNLLICELPKGDWAQTTLRQFFFSTFQFYFYSQLQMSNDKQLSAIAEKSLKEVTYHLRWSSEWVIRLGDGTEESSRRMKKALENLWMYAGELFLTTPYEQKAVNEGFGVNVVLLKDDWLNKVQHVFAEAKLTLPPLEAFVWNTGKEGRHTEHMGYLLGEMQYLQRTYPNVTW